MKRLLFIISCVCFWSLPSWATSNAQTPVFVQSGTTATAITATITATGAGHLLVACGYMHGGSTNTDTFTMTVTGTSDTFTHCPNCQLASVGQPSFQDCWYILSTSSGNTAVTFTDSTASNDERFLGVWEVAGCTSCAFDTSTFAAGSSSTTPPGPSVTVAATNSFIATLGITTGSTTLNGINSGNAFTQDGVHTGSPREGGIASMFDTAAGSHQPVWNTSGSDSIFGSILSFKKSGTAPRSLIIGGGLF